MDKKYDVPLNDFAIGRNTTYAEIFVVISYRPWNAWNSSTDFKWRTRKRPDGTLGWLSEAN
jgi:hypothetical protein